MPEIKNAGVRRRKGSPTPQPQKPVPNSDLLDQITVTPGIPRKLAGLFFGPPKTGKTTVACSGGKTLLINFDPDGAGTKTLKGRDDLRVVEPTLAQLDTLIGRLHGDLNGEFPHVSLDSLTFLFQLVGGKDLHETFIAGKDVRRSYGKAGAAVAQIINDLVSIPNSNVYFTAHLEKEQSDDDDGIGLDQDLGEHEVKVAVTPMVWKVLSPAVGFIGRTYKTRELQTVGKAKKPVVVHKVSFNDGERSPAGSRYSMAGEYIVTPTLLSEIEAELREGGS